MPKFRVVVSREWTEPGEVVVEAVDEDEARELVENLMSTGDEAVEWDSNNMDPGQDSIEGVTEI
jgi:ArsR family metal-binding transcriptional regulator